MKTLIYSSLLGLAASLTVHAAPPSSTTSGHQCGVTYKTVTAEVQTNPAKVLIIVSDRTAAHPECACEIVKAAILATKAKPELAAAIVEAAINSAPDQVSIIAKCGIAAAPDAAALIANIAGVDSSVAAAAGGGNPLDMPGAPGTVPTQGGIGSSGPPAIVNPPVVTDVEP
ncbi:MAG: hypothetical protein V4733_09775 [Verrucomicrobiota bacterium]